MCDRKLGIMMSSSRPLCIPQCMILWPCAALVALTAVSSCTLIRYSSHQVITCLAIAHQGEVFNMKKATAILVETVEL